MQHDNVYKLEYEVANGEKANFAYEHFIKEFIESKREHLFSTFQELPISESEALMEVKRLLSTLNALEVEIKSVIETGQMASIALNKQEKH